MNKQIFAHIIGNRTFLVFSWDKGNETYRQAINIDSISAVSLSFLNDKFNFQLSILIKQKLRLFDVFFDDYFYDEDDKCFKAVISILDGTAQTLSRLLMGTELHKTA